MKVLKFDLPNLVCAFVVLYDSIISILININNI